LPIFFTRRATVSIVPRGETGRNGALAQNPAVEETKRDEGHVSMEIQGTPAATGEAQQRPGFVRLP